MILCNVWYAIVVRLCTSQFQTIGRYEVVSVVACIRRHIEREARAGGFECWIALVILLAGG